MKLALPLSVATLTLIAGTLGAQSVQTLPQGFATTEGAYSRHVPLRYAPARIQCGYSAAATGWTRPMVIQKLTVRADGTAYLNNGFTVEMQVWLSSNGCKPAVASNKYAQNHGIDVRLFMKKKKVNFKSFTRGSGVNPFNIELKGDNTFVAIKREIVIDWATYSATNLNNLNFYVDADRAATTGTRGQISYYGTACNPTTFYAYATGNNVNDAFRTYCYTRSQGDAVLMWLSPKRVNASLGGGCTIYADFAAPGAVIFPTALLTTVTTGYANFVWGSVPASLKGKKLWTQAFAVNAQGLRRWSRGAEVTFGDFGPKYLTGHRYYYASGTRKFDPDKDDAVYGWTGTAIIFKIN